MTTILRSQQASGPALVDPPLGAIGRRRFSFARVSVGLAVAALILVCALQLGARTEVSPTALPGLGASHALRVQGVRALLGLPVAAQGPVSAALGGDLPAYHLAGLRAVTPDQDMRAKFTRRGVTIDSGNMRLGLALGGFGVAGAIRPFPSVAPQIRGNRVSYRYGAVTESWANGPLGLEQSFVVASRPRASGDHLVFSTRVSGVREQMSSGDVLLSSGDETLRYGGLIATDANGRRLSAHLGQTDGRIVITVSDRHAQFPVRVDPLVQQSELTASDGAAGDHFGFAVAISGSTVVVGAYNQINNHYFNGAAYVFVEPGGGWAAASSQVAKLAYAGTTHGAAFGYSVGISGNAIAIGAPLDNSGYIPNPLVFTPHGSVYVFNEPAAGWSGTLTPNDELTASDPGKSDELGASVAIDGDTIAAGAPFHSPSDFNQGAIYVFQKPGSTWSGSQSQSAELVASNPAAQDTLGFQIALSGQTIVGGVPNAAYVFQEPVGGWSGTITQSATLTQPGTTGGFGASVGVSGSTIAVGAPETSVGTRTAQGAVYVFNEPTAASGWTGTLTPSAELTGSAADKPDGLGTSVAVSGSTIAAGELSQPGGIPAVYVFQEPASGWSGSVTEAAQLTGSDEAIGAEFGITSNTNEYLGSQALAISCQTGTIVVGANLHSVNGKNAQGAAYVFGQSGSSSGQDRGRSPLAAAATGEPCKLDVTVKRVGSPARSGLAVDKDFGASFFQSYPHCDSGCANLVVTVTNDATKQPVEGATVDVSVNNIPHVTGEEYFCEQKATERSPNCGTPRYLPNLKTDANGQVKLIYWAPGLIENEPVTVTAIANAGSACPGTSRSCTLSTETGTGETKFTVQRHLLYEATGTITKEEADELIEWTGYKGLVFAIGKPTTEFVLDEAIHWLVEEEEAAESASGLLTIAGGLVEVAHLYGEEKEQTANIAIFLRALGVNPTGLDVDPFTHVVHAGVDVPFRDLLAKGVTRIGHIGASGVVWEFAKTLAHLARNHDPAAGAQTLFVRAYEVSTCKQGSTCGPGYHEGDGLEPKVDFVITAEHNHNEVTVPESNPITFTVPYSPAWTHTQDGIKTG